MEPNRKGSFWRIIQSWWILLTFTFFFNWLAFFYISFRARHIRWTLWGLVYSLPFILLVADMYTTDTWQYSVIMSGLLLGGLSSIIHGFKVRKEFLLRLEARQLQRASKGEDLSLERKIEAEYGIQLSSPSSKPVQEPVPAAAAMPKQPVSEPVKPVQREQASPDKTVTPPVRPNSTSQVSAPQPKPEDAMKQQAEPSSVPSPEPVSSEGTLELNTASEEAIAKLPGIGAVLAKKAIQFRNTNGSFRSLEEFTDLLGLKPHIVERIRPLVNVNAVSPAPSQPSGRVVDF